MDTDLSDNHHVNPHFNDDKELLVICSVNDRFQKTLDYRAYRLSDKSSHYDEEVA